MANVKMAPFQLTLIPQTTGLRWRITTANRKMDDCSFVQLVWNIDIPH